MTWMYQIMGPVLREIGAQANDAQAIHQSAMDRMKAGDPGYKPANLVSFLEKHPGTAVVGTTRVTRGVPCRK